MGFFDKIKEGLRKTRENISGSIESMLNSFTKIDEELFEELEELLVMGDVGIHTAGRICEELRVRVKKQGVTDPNAVMDLLKEIVADMLSGGEELDLSGKPTAILVIGVNGVGKTTTIGKIASRLKSEGNKVVLGAADTFRAAAIDQLEVWAQRADVPIVVRPEGSDPASVVFDTIAKAKSLHADVLICDTAGRLHNKKNLMDELSKMSRIIDRELPDSSRETLLVLDATTGQNAVNQAREFKNAAGITGIVLTKLDGTAKGGVVLAIREELQLPVKFIGVGEQIDDLQPFDARAFAEALFDNSNEVDEETAQRIAEQNARYDEYGELVEEQDEWVDWESENKSTQPQAEDEEWIDWDALEAAEEAVRKDAEDNEPASWEETKKAVAVEEVAPVAEEPVAEPVVEEAVPAEEPIAEEPASVEAVEEAVAEEPVVEAAEDVAEPITEPEQPAEATDEEWSDEPYDETQDIPEEDEAPRKETREERRARKEREKAERRAEKEARKEERRQNSRWFK